MTKAELSAKVSEKTGIARTKAEQAVNAVFDTLTETFKDGESCTQTGFGSFSVQDRPERKGRNPQTGAEITIPANRAVKFSMGNALKEALNK